MPTKRQRCQHPVHYETDWLGRTYVGCPICNRWRLLKTKAAASEAKRLAA
ncbi:MAG TPA: hypothetical protein VEU74_11430 [Gemmatimonadales bacterium]|nr:hypothetical protein [Gemmatimonadales bacterium]